MARLARITQQIFGAAGNVGAGGFGAAAAGNVTTALATSTALTTIMGTATWGTGWLDATLGATKFPAVEDMNAALYAATTQLAYLLQQGIAEYDAGTTYYAKNIVVNPGTYDIYGSVTNGNIGHALSDPTNWLFLGSLIAATPNLFTAGTSTGTANAQVFASLSPATGFSLSNNGQTIIGTAGLTNTGAMTFAITSPAISATAVKVNTSSGLADPPAGAVKVGDTIALTVNTAGACFVLEAGIPTSLFLQAANNLSDVANTTTALTNLGAAPLASPTFTGTPAAPTAASGTNTTQIASTAFVLARQLQNSQFASSGTFTTPSNINTSTIFKIIITGGGGGTASGNPTSGGGAGGTAIYYVSGLTPSTGYTVTIGGAGTGGGAGGAGGNSTIVIGATTVTANGGGAGTLASVGGAGGTATNGTINITGGDGGVATGSGSQGGDGGASYWGGGGSGGVANGNGVVGKAFGSGGGGTEGSGVGAAGKAGYCVIEWVA